jgi:putative DNA primase/helicase
VSTEQTEKPDRPGDDEAARQAWIAAAEADVRSRLGTRLPSDHPARAWAPDVAEQVEQAGAHVAKVARAAATQALDDARRATDLARADRAERWRLGLRRTATGSKWGTPAPDRWLAAARTITEALNDWLPDAGFTDDHFQMLEFLINEADRRDAAAAKARAEEIAEEIAQRKAPEAWEQEKERRRAESSIGDYGSGTTGNDDLLPAPTNPMAVARKLLPDWIEDGQLTLRHWRGTWMAWQRTHWSEIEERDVRSRLYRKLEHAEYVVTVNRFGHEFEDRRQWSPTKRKMADLLEAQAAIVHLSSDTNPPTWTATDRDQDHCDAYAAPGLIVACSNGLLDVPTRQLLPHDPRFFNIVSVPFGYDANATEPKRWLEFLQSLWPNDPDIIDVLQEYFGYVISGRTDLHKILLIVGPTRSGKGTLARVLTALIGIGNVVGPTLAGLVTNFGLSPLLGKPLAVVSDARLSGRDSRTVVERLLTISGEDTIDVDRKYRDPWTGKLPTRFLILSNELPNFGDASGAIAHRFLVLPMEVSWLGKENPKLTDELLEELPGILNWALDGIKRLTSQGRFTEPESSTNAVISMKDMASPMSAFVRESCEVKAGNEIEVDALYGAWKVWCEDNGRGAGNKQMFGKEVRAVVPQIKEYRPTAKPGESRPPRRYRGIALGSSYESNDHISDGRGPSRSERSADRSADRSDATVNDPDRDGPRPDAMWFQHSEDADAQEVPHSWPAHETGNCARCRKPCHRYGEGGSALCTDCKTTTDATHGNGAPA